MDIRTAADLTRVINLAKDSVDKSFFGPFSDVNPDNLKQKRVDPICFQLFTLVLSGLLQKITFPNEPVKEASGGIVDDGQHL